MTEVQKIIRKHYNSKFKNLNWETCGKAIQDLIRREEDKLANKEMYKKSNYPTQCALMEVMRNSIESEYESYFKVGNMFDWVNGNSNLKELLGISKKTSSACGEDELEK